MEVTSVVQCENELSNASPSVIFVVNRERPGIAHAGNWGLTHGQLYLQIAVAIILCSD